MLIISVAVSDREPSFVMQSSKSVQVSGFVGLAFLPVSLAHLIFLEY